MINRAEKSLRMLQRVKVVDTMKAPFSQLDPSLFGLDACAKLLARKGQLNAFMLQDTELHDFWNEAPSILSGSSLFESDIQDHSIGSGCRRAAGVRVNKLDLPG